MQHRFKACWERKIKRPSQCAACQARDGGECTKPKPFKSRKGKGRQLKLGELQAEAKAAAGMPLVSGAGNGKYADAGKYDAGSQVVRQRANRHTFVHEVQCSGALSLLHLVAAMDQFTALLVA